MTMKNEQDSKSPAIPPLPPAPCSAMHGATYKELDDANAALSAENAKLRVALEGWVKYFQRDVPITADAAEAQGEEFTHCWFETEKALSPNVRVSEPGGEKEKS